ncbi:unnamed protein product, partial [Mesorhabditis spiculigera]
MNDIVLNPLLTFLKNYRDHPMINRLIEGNFTKAQIEEATRIVERSLGLANVSIKLADLFKLADDRAVLPRFAVSDFKGLPMILSECRLSQAEEQEEASSYQPEPMNLSTSMTLEMSSASSPEIPTSATCSSAGSDSASSSSKQSPIPGCEMMSVIENPARAPKRKAVGKSLENALKKLSDKRVKPDEPKPILSVPPPTLLTALQNTQIPMLPHNLFPDLNRAMIGGIFDRNRYLQAAAMLNYIQQQQRNVQQAMAQRQQQVQQVQLQQQQQQQELIKEQQPEMITKEELDEKTDDDLEKESDSPSPSEEMKDEQDAENLADKPYVCGQSNCAKRFANKFLLKKHMFIHTGLRPHACPYCTKRFNRKDNLLRHKKTHIQHGVPPLAVFPPPFSLLVHGGDASDDVSD